MTELAEIRQTASPTREEWTDDLVFLNEQGRGSVPRLSILIPTRNEAANVAELLSQLQPTLAGIASEIIFVDDSDDDTTDELAKLGPGCAVGLRLLHRDPGARSGGLGGAVLAGMRAARGEW